MFKQKTMRCLCVKVAVSCCLALCAPASADDRSKDTNPYKKERTEMVRRQIASGGFFGRDAVEDQKVLEAIRSVPRHKFVPARLRDVAYSDRPLPIGHGQTISQPYIVAMMTELLELDANSKVLEIGTGSGYQAAVLAEITDHVYTIEIIPELAETAAETLKNCGYNEVHTRIGDGYYGWESEAPFDAIIVTAAASHIPPPLLEQLDVGGRMVVPVGPPMHTQKLMVVTKDDDGTVRKRSVMPVRFVPFTRGNPDKQ